MAGEQTRRMKGGGAKARRKLNERNMLNRLNELNQTDSSHSQFQSRTDCVHQPTITRQKVARARARNTGYNRKRVVTSAARALILMAILARSDLLSAVERFVSFKTNQFITEPISLADAVTIALRQSPAIRKAQKDIEATQGVVIQTKAIAVPKVQVTGHYSAVQPEDQD